MGISLLPVADFSFAEVTANFTLFPCLVCVYRKVKGLPPVDLASFEATPDFELEEFFSTD